MNKIISSEYKEWLKEIKQKFQSSQIKASIQVNSTLLEFYWNLGNEIVEKQKNSTWGSGFLQQLSNDLIAEFPNVKGFSKRNLELVRKWYLFWKQAVSQMEVENTKQLVSQFDEEKSQQVVAQILMIPWGHNIAIIQNAKPLVKLYIMYKTLSKMVLVEMYLYIK